ncbi:hypothetical protein [Rhizobium sullae]|nr:hypothetical protein [Rhizobium sullae]
MLILKHMPSSAALAFNKPIDGVWASDHFGVVVDVEVGLDA